MTGNWTWKTRYWEVFHHFLSHPISLAQMILDYFTLVFHLCHKNSSVTSPMPTLLTFHPLYCDWICSTNLMSWTFLFPLFHQLLKCSCLLSVSSSSLSFILLPLCLGHQTSFTCLARQCGALIISTLTLVEPFWLVLLLLDWQCSLWVLICA